MSDTSNEASGVSTQRNCQCYKKLGTYGIPLYISDENEFYGEGQKKINFEGAFKLPGILIINENIREYLFVETSELSNVFHYMAEVIPNLWDFEQNLLSFWILDMFIEGLWTAQNAKMNFDHQKATLYWIAYMFNYIQKENPSRNNLFDHLKEILFRQDATKSEKIGESVEGESDRREEESDTVEGDSGRKEEQGQDASTNSKEKEIWKLPLPPCVEKKQKEFNDEIKTSTSEEDYGNFTNKSWESWEGEKCSKDSKTSESVNDNVTNIAHMKVILEILYRIFGRFWVYSEIQTVFHAMPSIKQVDLPFTLQTPKTVLKADITARLRSDKNKVRPSYSEKSLEFDTVKRLLKNDFILPLQLADESKLILRQYFSLPSSQRSIPGRKKQNY